MLQNHKIHTFFGNILNNSSTFLTYASRNSLGVFHYLLNVVLCLSTFTDAFTKYLIRFFFVQFVQNKIISLFRPSLETFIQLRYCPRSP